MINQILQSIILGLAQGLGEFLPISSSAHLVIIPWLFNFSDPGLAFDVALHAGTLIAVLAYFWKDIIEILGLVFFKKYRVPNGEKIINYNPKTLWFLAIATIPGVIAGYFLEEKAETIFRHPLLVAGALITAGWILYLTDKYMKHRKDMTGINWKDSILIGLSQALAIIPGVSRSGATITAGLLMGLNRQSAARFSFLLSVPIIFGATFLKLPHLLKNGISLPVIVGITISAISGYLSIKYLIKFVEKTSYKIFFWYRLGLALIIALAFWAKMS
jgi:undecaprenyl-diphosphatase